MKFQDKLRKLRTEAGLSQESLADKVHISRSAIAKYENGNGKPSEDTLKALAFYFGVEISELRSDDDLKEESKKKKVIKLSAIVGSLTLVIAVLVASLTWLIQPQPGTSKKKVYSSIGLLNMATTVPIIVDESNKSKEYLVNTFLSFTISMHQEISEGEKADYLGNIVRFESQDFAQIHYNYNSNETNYIINFKKEGTFELFYHIEDYRQSVKFVCDDNSKKWDSYKMNMSNLYPWIEDISKENLTGFRYEESNSSIGPHYFRNIYYTEGKNDIEEAYSFLNNTVILSNSNQVLATGAGLQTITYYFRNYPSQSIEIYNNYYLYIDTFSTDLSFMVNKKIAVPMEYNDHRFGFNTYGSNIIAVNLKDNTMSPISYFYDLEFIEWPTDISYENSEPLFTIEGYPSEQIYIYGVDRFSYLGKMYQIVSSQKFTDLFN